MRTWKSYSLSIKVNKRENYRNACLKRIVLLHKETTDEKGIFSVQIQTNLLLYQKPCLKNQSPFQLTFLIMILKNLSLFSNKGKLEHGHSSEIKFPLKVKTILNYVKISKEISMLAVVFIVFRIQNLPQEISIE
jgi:hypothetical protein